MSFKEIVVYVDSMPESEVRVRSAVELAHRHGAHLVGVYVTPAILGHTPADSWAVGAGLVEVIDRYKALESRRIAAARRLFTTEAAPLEPATEWRSVPQGVPCEELMASTRYADLAIVGQRDEEGETSSWLPVLLGSGVPSLVFPQQWRGGTFGERALVAWNASREARRATLDALPLLATASTVTVVVVDPHDDAEHHGEEPGADIARYLARHGIRVHVEPIDSDGADTGGVILSRAAALDVDLIVMGAYGHSRFTELVLGGVTRTMLRGMPVPVLMAN